MSRLIDLTKQSPFGDLTVLKFSRATSTPGGGVQYRWLCQCKCGNVVEVDGCCLRRGSATHCGCRRGEWSITHNQSESPEYSTWLAMKQRCLNPKNKSFRYYGERGIVICGRWLDSFANFIEDMGKRPTPEHSLERIDNNGNYCPENCEWATKLVQATNSSQTKFITFDGQTKSRAEWARSIGIDRTTFRCRLDRLGWTIEAALTTPVRRMRRQRR